MCMQSMAHPSCPSLTFSNNYVRATLNNSGYVFTETNVPGVLRVTLYFDYGSDVSQGIPQNWMLNAIAKKRLKRIETLNTLIGTRMPSRESMLIRGTTMDVNNDRTFCKLNNVKSKCALCFNTFGLAVFQRKVHCRTCDEVNIVFSLFGLSTVIWVLIFLYYVVCM